MNIQTFNCFQGTLKIQGFCHLRRQGPACGTLVRGSALLRGPAGLADRPAPISSQRYCSLLPHPKSSDVTRLKSVSL